MNMIDQPLGELARSIPGATRVFNEYQLDFCCGGRHTLREAAAQRELDPGVVAERLAALVGEVPERDWNAASNAELIEHILARFHERHREQLPELIDLAVKVERVHADRPECPAGLAEHLRVMRQELESHMRKEEQVLFPMIVRGHGAMAGGPITVMRMEHDHHGAALRRLGEITHDMTLPASGACATWQALYQGLRTLRDDLMEHIHLENNILFDHVAGWPARR